MKMFVIWSLFALTAVIECNVKKECPPKEMLSSCSCLDMYNFNVVNCGGIVNIWDLIQDLHVLKDYSVYQVNLVQVDVQYLPAGFLKYLPIKSLTIRESTILALESEDGKVMFEGADESLEDIFIIAVAGVSSWRWKPLQALKNLKVLVVSTCEIRGVEADFNTLSKQLVEISLNNNEISFIDKSAFSSYVNMKSLDLTRNEITDIKRSMFPNPAKALEKLKLSVNKIEVLPDDIFTNMPNLKEIHLRETKIKWLHEGPFIPVKNHLNRLVLDDNNIHCCKNIAWIVTSQLKKHATGTCGFPKVISGKELSALDTSDLDHGMC